MALGTDLVVFVLLFLVLLALGVLRLRDREADAPVIAYRGGLWLLAWCGASIALRAFELA